jgi:hypothetical protein
MNSGSEIVRSVREEFGDEVFITEGHAPGMALIERIDAALAVPSASEAIRTDEAAQTVEQRIAAIRARCDEMRGRAVDPDGHPMLADMGWLLDRLAETLSACSVCGKTITAAICGAHRWGNGTTPVAAPPEDGSAADAPIANAADCLTCSSKRYPVCIHGGAARSSGGETPAGMVKNRAGDYVYVDAEGRCRECGQTLERCFDEHR